MLGAFLPFLAVSHGLSMTQAGLLGSALVVSSSLTQPIYGYLADRTRRNVFLTLSPAVAGLFISSLGVAPNFSAMVVLVLLGGVGVAAFHPQATAVAAETKRENPGVQLSIFITAGTMGFSFGPIFIAAVISVFGISQSYWAAVPGLLIAAYLVRQGDMLDRSRPQPRRVEVWESVREQSKGLVVLFGLTVVRSGLQVVFVSFLPLYLTTRGYSAYQAGIALSVFLFVGAIGVFSGGIWSDRVGGKRVILISMIGSFPLMLAFLLTDGFVSLLLCMLGSWFLYMTLPVNVAMAQKLVPEGASTISAFMMGFAWGIGGVALPITGVLGDVWGLQATLVYMVLFSSVAVVLALLLPGEKRTA
jgi:FSR family fosmidomycin resistance protein-like MFS transporter